MTELICESCGERNPAGTEFCTVCNAYLAWDRTRAFTPPSLPTPPSPPSPSSSPSSPAAPAPAVTSPPPPARPPVARPAPAGDVPVVFSRSSADAPAPRLRRPAAPVAPAPPPAGGPRTAELLRVVADRTVATLIPGGESATLELTAYNASRIVDRYVADIPDAPSWLSLTADELRLAPQSDGAMHVRLRIPAPPLVAAGSHRLTLRVRSVTEAAAVWSVPFELTVGVVDAPVGMVLEPLLVRVRDVPGGQLRVLLDNRNSNRPVEVSLAGSDPEGALRFEFAPPRTVLPPMGSAVVALRLAGPPPAVGAEVTRQFTVTATGGVREAVVAGTFVQATSAQGLNLLVEPARQTVRDTGGADYWLAVQYSGGPRKVRLTLRGSDPERLGRITFQPPVLDLAAAGTSRVRMHVEFPLPEPGQQVTREISVAVTGGEHLTATGTATLIQHRSPDALQLRLEPSVIKVRDTPYGRAQLVADNRQGVRPVRMSLAGSDPELSIGFLFTPPLLEVAAGQVATVTVDISAALPEPGTEVSRPFAVRAGGPERSQEVAGTFTLVASEPAISDLAIRLEPPVHRVQGRARGSVLVLADNRTGTAPVQIYWQGTDAEGVVQFVFDPPALVVPPGGTAASRVTLSAPSPGRGTEKIRSVIVSATDGVRSVETTGSLVQAGADRRPIWGMLLAVLGALMMIAGVFLPWVASPQRLTGLNLSLVEFAQLTRIDLARLNFNLEILRQIPRQLISAGIVVLLFAALQLFGLTGRTGRLIRAGAGLTFVFVLGFILALVFQAGDWSPGPGIFLVAGGAVLGFVGGLLSRR